MRRKADRIHPQTQRRRQPPDQPSKPSKPNRPSKPSKPDTTPSVTPTPTVTLDTTAVNLGSNQHYQFLVKGNNDTANLNVASSNPNVATVSLVDGKNSRGAKYQVNAKSLGTAEIRVTYQGGSAVIKVNVTHTGTITLDTTNYTMPHGGSYTIGVTAQQNGQPLTAQQLQAMITRGQLVIRIPEPEASSSLWRFYQTEMCGSRAQIQKVPPILYLS